MQFFTTGIESVDKMGQLSYTGNIKPIIWNKTILNDKGKPYRLAMDILADIAYWYKPTEIRDETSGQVIGWKKKFASNMLQRSYKEMVDLYGEEDRTIRRAIAYLEEIGVIKRVLRTIRYKNGTTLNNVLFIDLNVDKLYDLTYPNIEEVSTDGLSDLPAGEYEILGEDTPMDKSDYPYGQICPQGSTNLSTPPDKFVERVSTDLSTPLDRNDHTYTEISTENTNSYHSFLLDSAEGKKEEYIPETIIVDSRAVFLPEDYSYVVHVLEENGGIPKSLVTEPEMMKKVIMFLVDWNNREDSRKFSSFERHVYVQVVECIVEMATTLKPCCYKGSKVTYGNVIDRLNQFCSKEPWYEGALVLFMEEVVSRTMDALRHNNVRDSKSYIKSIIWEQLSTQQMTLYATFS